MGGRRRFDDAAGGVRLVGMRNRQLTIIVVLVGLGLTGCQGLTEQQRAWLANGERAYTDGRYPQAVEELTRFVNAVPNRPETNRALYVRGLAHVRSQQRLDARTDLRRCAETSADADLRWRAYAVLGTIDYEDRQWSAAARAYASAAESAPRTPPTDVILFRLGVCCERSGEWERALEPYREIVTHFSSSSVRAAAQRRLQIKADHFAIQCGVFSSEENAVRAVGNLRRDGLSAYVRDEPRGGVRMKVVLVGRFARYEEALRELSRVKGYVPEAVLWP